MDFFSYFVVGFVCGVARVCVLSVRLAKCEWSDNLPWLFVCEFVLFCGLWVFVALWGLFRITTGGICFTSVYDKTSPSDI